MRITIIDPKIGYAPLEPLGILYLGTVVRNEGHAVQLLDVVPNDDVFIEKIKRFKPQIIGFSVMTPSYTMVIKLLMRP